jgi:2-aminoadipate transaminase
MTWTLSRRAARLNPSILREILKTTDVPGLLSLAGGLPAAEAFPVEAVREACQRVLAEAPHAALQYAASEGFMPLREWVAAEMGRHGAAVSPDQVLITTGSQQGLDLCAKVLIDAGSRIAVEAPTYLGALQAFAPFEPEVLALPGDGDGVLPEALRQAAGARLLYLVPSFHNPTGCCMSDGRRDAVLAEAERWQLPVLEDNPYGELWYEAPPPRPLVARDPSRVVYLGSFSKVLAPGLRLGYVVAPPVLFPKLLQAKQAADLHSPGFNQRVVWQILDSGLLQSHLPALRERYRAQRDAMQTALERHLAPLQCRWQRPVGGMFFWLDLPDAIDAMALLPKAVAAGVAFVPGAAFYSAGARANTMRLGFVTLSPADIEVAVARLAAVLRDAL